MLCGALCIGQDRTELDGSNKSAVRRSLLRVKKIKVSLEQIQVDCILTVSTEKKNMHCTMLFLSWQQAKHQLGGNFTLMVEDKSMRAIYTEKMTYGSNHRHQTFIHPTCVLFTLSHATRCHIRNKLCTNPYNFKRYSVLIAYGFDSNSNLLNYQAEVK
jgi:hypothetical protein